MSELTDRSVENAAGLGRTEANRINLELLKGEVRTLEKRLLELGFAFAPATGLDGAGARFSELREQINAIERRLRYGQNSEASADTAPALDVEPSSPGVASELFNYVGFERRFRGDPAEVLASQAERYADMLAPHGPVVDIGCGRAELLQLLAERGVEVIGVDTDAGMVSEGRARGLQIEHTDAISFLKRAEPGSLGAIFSAHVAEHLELDVLITFIELALSRLKPGGLFVAETPNPQSLIVLGNSYILDPTHVRPLHPSLFAFLCESAGYRDVRLHFYEPATGYHLGFIDDPKAPEWVTQLNNNFRRLNEVLFGPQEYAVIATKAPEE
jgi:SAM-dependent methyltransferase